MYKEPSWGWSIGAGTYDQTSQQFFLMERQEQVELEQKQALSQMIIIGSITTIIVALFSLIMSRMIARRFQLFQSKINNDFNQLQQTKDKLEHMALHDELTGLPNRSLLHEHIAQGVKTSSDNCQQLAVMFVDLDDFKKVNDLYGHSAGDRLLSEIGKKSSKPSLNPTSLSLALAETSLFSASRV
ncbi:GGDEF domain-containing protein [Vibrio sinaloensis]|nr:GGDEF domain-containing protein [Vibrio sinaloensis]